MFIGHIQYKRDLTGYIESNLLEPCSLWGRHQALVKEMLRRGFQHKSPVPDPSKIDLDYMPDWQKGYMIDVNTSLKELLARCKRCKELYDAKG
jgi:hypothetical protein